MQSANYVPGMTGWKIHDGVRLELNDGNRRIYAEVKMITNAGPGQTNDEAAQAVRDLDVGNLSRVTSCEGKVTPQGHSLTAQGRAVYELTSRVAGQGENLPVGDMSGYITGEKPARQAAEQLRRQEEADIAAARRINALSAYGGDLAEVVRQVIREELQPGGLLHSR
jgi:hypothetical protein